MNVAFGRYLTAETIWLVLSGLASGLGTGLVLPRIHRLRWGATPLVVAVLAAATVSGRLDWFGWSPQIVVCLVVLGFGAFGAGRLLAEFPSCWLWVATSAFVSALGVWAGVPETGPALLVAGSLVGVVAAALITGSSWAPAAGWVAVATLGWAALSGAAGRPWAAIGGSLCTGVMPWLALSSLVPRAKSHGWTGRPGADLLAAHTALVIVASRWIGVVPHAGWWRVAAVATAGMAVAGVARLRA